MNEPLFADVTEQPIVTVSQVNRKIADLLKSDKTLAGLYIDGEISNFTHHRSGHLYFTLKDEESSVKAVMFKGSAQSLDFAPESGMKVTVKADVRVFERDGLYQLYVFEIAPQGMGALYAKFMALRQRLEAEGLFEQKRSIPRNPVTIAVITADTGAALQDVLNILGRRNPLVKVLLIPALVQGANAPASLIGAIRTAQTTTADVIIFGRGGGSIEDLWAFNDEALAREIFASAIPTISAVGHEVDFTIADFVADLRAPTPSAAAELSVGDVGEIYDSLSAVQANLRLALNRFITLNAQRVDALGRELYAKSPSARLNVYGERLDVFERQLASAMQTSIANKRQQLITQMKQIDALSPLKVLTRGYSIVTDEKANKAVIDSADLRVGDDISVRLHKGKIKAKVKEVLHG
ncbi:MAG: exodeoxyribonuclease VII large subunit [Oscillospiraceae bacterium]|nr:exodeoxyribonuclease VII large subunit [Oscillospiraceae bacterium]